MNVLVDYDNIPALERNRGPVHVATRIVAALGPFLAGEPNVRFRFYGGWFDGAILSRLAQRLSPAIAAEFPRPVTLSGGLPSSSLVARAELALTLEAAPGKYLTHTYRERSIPETIRCAPLPFAGCAAPGACPMAPLHALFRDSECPEPRCAVDIPRVLTKPEQKLVDTMLSVDMIHLALSTNSALAVVSTDDDLWPAIQAVLVYGARVIHVHPVPGRSTPPHYASLAVGQYDQCTF